MSKNRLWIGSGDHPDILAVQMPRSKNPGCTAFFPLDDAMESVPEGGEFICSINTSPRPGSDIRSGYFVAPTCVAGWQWILWSLDWDDNWETWEWRVCATTDGSFLSSKEAARHLLFERWRFERSEYDSEIFEELEQTELLSDSEVREISQRAFK